MEITLSELLRYVLTVAFIAGFAWALWVMYRYYHTEEQPVRLLRMMERLGLDTETAKELPLPYYLPTAARVCRHCESKTECDVWLAKEGKAITPPAFCANAGFLGLVARENQIAA